MNTVQDEVDRIVFADGYTMQHNCTAYKFGAHGFVYRWSDSSRAWIKSDVAPATLRHPIAMKIIKDRNEAAN